MLANDLRIDFPDMSGLSAANLWRMRQFYLFYCQYEHQQENEKLAATLRELCNSSDLKQLLYNLSWTHHTIIMGACTTPLARILYSKRKLVNQKKLRCLARLLYL